MDVISAHIGVVPAHPVMVRHANDLTNPWRNRERDMHVLQHVSASIPDDLRDLLDQPLFAALGTVRPDNSVQVNPMWFDYDGEHVRFTHTTYRVKYRNLQKNPSMSLLLTDPEDPQRYLELRGELASVEPDPQGAFYVHLGRRYGNPDQQPPPDAADRVILHMRVDRVSRH